MCIYQKRFVLYVTSFPYKSLTNRNQRNLNEVDNFLIVVLEIVFRNCAPFTDRISEINNTQVDNAKDIDVVIPMFNLIESE